MRTSLATILRDIAEADMPISEIARYAHILSPEVIHYESDHEHLFFFPDGTSTALARHHHHRRGEPAPAPAPALEQAL